MDLSGHKFRSVAESTDFSFSTNFQLENQTGIGEFSLSGENNKIKFNFTSGKIYDDNNNYVSSYLESDQIDISGDVSSTSYSYYINEKPFALGKAKSNFKLQKFCFESTGLNFFNVATEIRGTKPDYYIDFPNEFVHSGHHTGHIVNNSSTLGFRVLGIDVINDNEPFWSVSSFDKNIAANNSGQIVVQDLSGHPVFYDAKYDLRVHTNFGPVVTGISGQSVPSNPRNVDFSVIKIHSGINQTGQSFNFQNGDTKTNIYLINYSAFSGITPSGDKKLRISLDYNGGTTGDFFNGPGSTVAATGEDYIVKLRDDDSVPYRKGFITGTTTGIFTGIGLVEGSGFLGLEEKVLLKAQGHTGNFISGYNTAKLETFVYASGEFANSVVTGSKTISPYGTDNDIFIASGSGIPMEYYNSTWNFTPGNYVATTGEVTGTFSGIDITASDLGKKYYQKYITGSIGSTTTHSETSHSWAADLTGAKAVDAQYAGSGITGVTAHSGLWSGDILASANTYFSGSGSFTGELTGYTKSFTGSYKMYTGLSGEFGYYESGIGAGSYIWGPHGNIGVGANAGNVGVYTGYKGADNFVMEANGDSSETVYVEFTSNFDYEPINALLTISGIDGNIYTDRITGIR